MRERYLASNSRVKRSLIEGNGYRVLHNPALLRNIQVSEDGFYKIKATELGLKDGLIFPYEIPHKGESQELPYAVADTKANTVERFLDHQQGIRLPVDVNDSVWGFGGKDWNLYMAVNKTDPYRNGDDVDRLASFLHSQEGFYFYSTGVSIEVDPVSRDRKIQSGKLRVGRVANLQRDQIQEILREHLPRTGAFDLRFILTEGIVEIPDYFAGVITRSNGSVHTWRSRPNEISYRNLQLAAHGMDFFQEET